MLFVCTSTPAQDAKDNIRAAYEALNKRDFDAFIKYCDPNFTEYAAGPQPIVTPKAAIEAYKMYFTAFPDLRFHIDHITQGDDGKYYLEVNITGTNTGPFMMLPPTNKPVKVRDMDILEVNAQGKALSHASAHPTAMIEAIGYGSINNPSTHVVMTAYEMFGKQDMEGLSKITTEDVEFDIHDVSVYSEARKFKGREQVKQFFTDLDNKLEYIRFQPWRFVADGDDVFVLIDAQYKDRTSGKITSTEYTHHFVIRDGKIRSFKGLSEI